MTHIFKAKREENPPTHMKESQERNMDTSACGKIIKKEKTTQIKKKQHKCQWQTKNGCPSQASKQMEPNGQQARKRERMAKTMRKDEGEKGMEENPLLIENSWELPDSEAL